jgi:hypothetical protein
VRAAKQIASIDDTGGDLREDMLDPDTGRPIDINYVDTTPLGSFMTVFFRGPKGDPIPYEHSGY